MIGLLCYESCSAINGGMVNCGPGGCSRDSNTCATELAEMTTSVLMGFLDLIGFVASFGASGSTKLFNMKNVMDNAFETVGTNGLLAIAEKAKEYLDNSSVRSGTYTQAYSYVTGDLGISVSQSEFNSFCGNIIDGVKSKSSLPHNKQKLLDALDIFGI